jgi:hypothetical protein
MNGAVSLSATEDYPLNTWVSSDVGSVLGPDLSSIPVYSGSMLVVVSAEIQVGGGSNVADAFYSWSLSGPTNVAEDTTRALSVHWVPSLTDPTKIQASYSRMHTGLTPGTYDITSKYRCNSIGTSPLSGAVIKNRHILAIPF